MMYSYQGQHPKALHEPWDGWVAPTATLIGLVELGRQVSIWFGAVVRADNCVVRIGDFSNIQENSVLHTDAGLELNIGEYVTIGHKVMLHGCTIGDNSLIGMNAVILNRAVIGKNCIIGANALIPEGKVIPDNSVVMGSPGKIVKTLDEDGAAKIRLSALHYAEHFKNYADLKEFHF